jgi:uncharacterized protein involved in type VI secretion and phage assembly
MDPFDPDRPDMPLTALFTGVVVDREDPQKLGRVRVTIPGLIEEGSAWAMPLSFGGWAKKRGAIFVPPVGADVGILFRMGDIDQPFYLGGWPGPGEQLTGTEGEPDAQAIETEHYSILIDDRPESRSLTLLDKESGNQIQLNGVARSVSIKATSVLSIECDGFIYIKGLEVFVNGVAAGFGKV